MGNPFVLDSDEEEPEEEEEEGEDFEVEAILGRRNTQTDQRQYFIKWKGYDDPSENTWEPEENLDGAQELLEEFKRRYGTIHDIDLTVPKKEKEKRGRDREHHKKHSREDRGRSTARSEKTDVKHQKRAQSHMAPSVSGLKQEQEHKYKPSAPYTTAGASISAEERRKQLESAFAGSSPPTTHKDSSAVKPSTSANQEDAPTLDTEAAATKEKPPKKPKKPKNDSVRATNGLVTQSGEKPPKKVKPPKDGKEVPASTKLPPAKPTAPSDATAPTKRPSAKATASDATKPTSAEAGAQEKKVKLDVPETPEVAGPSTSAAPQAANGDVKPAKPEPTPSTSRAEGATPAQAEVNPKAARIDEMLAKQARGEGLSYIELKQNELSGFQRGLKVEQVRVIRRPGGADRCALVKFENEKHAQLHELQEVLANAPRELAIAFHHQLGLKM
ncbi:chromo domain-containing protein [Aphelenchoides avenae]|nr:chromo domain-containing protein [Aphelenchus avenae]